MLLLTLLTAGTFPIVWLAANLEALNTFVKGRKLQLMDVVVIGTLFWWPLLLMGYISTTSEQTQAIFNACWGVANIALYVYLYVYITKPVIDSLEPVLEQHQIVLKRKGLRAFIFSYLYIVIVLNQLSQAVSQQKQADSRAS